jgi:predicted acyltransferase
VALPFSIASRRARGPSIPFMTLHAVWRALILIVLGFFLRSLSSSRTNFTFEDTLTQIGLGYVFLFLLGFRPTRDQWIAFAVIIFGYWLAFVLYTLPSSSFDYGKVGVSSAWLEKHRLTGFAAHWNKNSNMSWAFDKWFHNLLPRPKTFLYNDGGYATLSFIPTLGTMILGLIAGGILRGERAPAAKIRWFVIAGVIGLVSAWALNATGVCPVVKRIWTPSWTLFSGGWCFLFMAAFYALVDLARLRPVVFPLIVIGMNSIAAYCIAHLFDSLIGGALNRHLPVGTFSSLGRAYQPFLHGAAILLVYWLILFWMYRRRIFLRI